MASADDYIALAQSCLDQAKTASEAERADLQKLAEEWLKLANDGVLMPASPTPPKH